MTQHANVGPAISYSIIIPAFNEADYLEATLARVRQCMEAVAIDSGPNFGQGELIVVDNNSTDATVSIAQSYGATVVFEPHNQISRARNRGASVAGGSMLIFLDADTELSITLLSQAVGYMQSGDCVGGGVLVEPDQPVSHSVRRFINCWNFAAKKFGIAAGCFVYCRRDAFEAIGGFSEKIYASEEVWLSRALRRYGRQRNMKFRVIQEPPIVTSMRKLEWYNRWQLLAQALVLLIPLTLYSRRLCALWYQRPQ